MRSIVCLSLSMHLAVLMAVPAVAEDTAPIYKQTYTILIKGIRAGSESVAESIDETGNIRASSEHEIFITDGLATKRMAFVTKMQLAKNTYHPIAYSYTYTTAGSGDSYEVAVKNDQIQRKLIRSGHATEATAPFQPNTVIQDFNVYHQYDYIVRRYDAAKGGRQLFSNFVPLIAMDIPVAVTYQGEAELTAASGSIPVSNYTFEFVGIANVTLAVDKDKRLVRLAIPTQDLEVVRKDLLPAEIP